MMWQISKGGRLERLVVFLGSDAIPVGELQFLGTGKVRKSVFRYARTWLDHPERRPLSLVELPLRPKAKDSAPHEVPLPFYDAAPEGWGRSVLEAAFPMQWEPHAPSLDVPNGTETLEELVLAAEAVDAGLPTAHHLRLLFRASAGAGGARPKARLRHQGADWIAKFKAWGDGFDNPRMEAVCLSMAEECGITVPGHHLVSVAGRSVLLVKRFDRSALIVTRSPQRTARPCLPS